MLTSQVMPLAGARLSEDRVYRYMLYRRWGEGPQSLFVCLNPSTADELADDPTVRRIKGFAQSWGDGGMAVVNLFALRATKPEALLGHPDPVGPGNDAAILRAARQAFRIVLAWGQVPRRLDGRAAQVLELLAGHRLYCLGTTAAGAPRHPLYLAKDTPLALYREAEHGH